MKENAIKKINQMGKIGDIVITIAKVFCIVGLICTVVGTIILGSMPSDFILFQGGGSGTININVASIGQTLTDEDYKKINDGSIMKDSNLELRANGETLQFDEISAKDNIVTLSASGDMKDQISLHNLVYVLVVVNIAIVLTLVILFFGGFLCKAFKNCESPFEENVINKMRNFAYSLIPWVIMSSFQESMISSLMAGRVDINFSLDVNMTVIVLIVLFLTYIFKYGAILQQESDETL